MDVRILSIKYSGKIFPKFPVRIIDPQKFIMYLKLFFKLLYVLLWHGNGIF